MPTELNFRANIFGMKMLGVEYILSASAVGSLQEQYVPLHLVIPDQFFDRTKGRVSTFFGNGLVAHVGFAHPVCASRSATVAYEACRDGRRDGAPAAAPTSAWKGRSSRRSRSRSCIASWGMDIIGMTNLQEAKLAREAEICYATIALVTDYDCWHPDHDSVTVDMIIANLVANAKTAQQVIAEAVAGLPYERTCECATALQHAIITRPESVPESQARPCADHREVHEVGPRVEVDLENRSDRGPTTNDRRLMSTSS